MIGKIIQIVHQLTAARGWLRVRNRIPEDFRTEFVTVSFQTRREHPADGSLIIDQQRTENPGPLRKDDGCSLPCAQFFCSCSIPMSVTSDSGTHALFQFQSGRETCERFDDRIKSFLERWAQEIEMLSLNES